MKFLALLLLCVLSAGCRSSCFEFTSRIEDGHEAQIEITGHQPRIHATSTAS